MGNWHWNYYYILNSLISHRYPCWVPRKAKGTTSIMGVTMGLFLVFLLIILQIYNSSLIIENVDVDWANAI